MLTLTDVPPDQTHHRSWLEQLPRWVVPVVVFAASLVVFGYSAFLDPEPHHDGIQIAPAIAIAEGLRVHADVFDQYGPITAWIHGAAVEVFGPRLLTIRLVTAVFLAVSSALIVVIARRFIRGELVPLLVAGAWVATWPGRSVDAVTYLFLPWPSITFLVFQLLAALLLLEIVSGQRRGPVRAAVLGAIIGIAALTRLNYGVPMALMVVVVLALLVPWRVGEGRRFAAGFLLGSVGLVVVVLGWLTATGSLMPFVQDAILSPLSGDATDGATQWFFYRNAVILGSIPVLAVLAAVLLAAWRWPRDRRWPWVLGVLGVVALSLWATTSIAGSPLRDLILSRVTWAPALDHEGFQPLYAMVCLLPIAVLAILRTAWKGLASRQPSEDGPISLPGRLRSLAATRRTELALLLIAVASMVQCYPFIDPNHLWWAAPLPLILVVHAFTRSLQPRWALAAAGVFLLPALVVAVPRAIDYVSTPRTALQGGVLDGMLVPDDRVDDIALAQSLLGELSPGVNRFDCWNGLFAVWNGQYLADSSAFVHWAPRFAASENLGPDGRIVRCLEVAPDGQPVEAPIPDGFVSSRLQGPISISYYNLMYLQVLEPEPTP